MRLNDNNTFIGINPPYQLSVIHSSKLIYPREIYQRGVERKRVELIARDFNEYIVNEPKVSFRNGRYYVMDGQHTIEGCILLNGGEDRPILCKVYTGLTMEQEALLFAEQNGHAAPLSAGIKLRAKVVGGDAPSKAFVAATNRAGLSLNYDSMQLSDYRIVVDGVQGRFRTTNWYITAAVTLLSGILAYFVSGRALKPLRSFTSQVEQVQLNNLADMRIDEDPISEFRQLSRSFNQMLERLNNAFSAQRQFTGNAAHELRTPLALMQAQLELFSAEHPDVRPETAEFLTLLREQTERLTQMTKTLLEMSNLQQVARNEQLQLAPMVEEIFTDLASLAEKRSITLEAEGDAALTGSDALIYRMLFNLTENAVKYNRLGGSVRVELAQGQEKCIIRVSDTGCGIPEEYQRSIFHPFFRVDKSRSREYGGAGLGLSLVWEIADLHGGSVWVEESSDKGTTIAVELPAGAEKTAQAMASRCFCPPDRVEGCASLYS